MEDIGEGIGVIHRINHGQDEEARKNTFSELKVYCLDLLDFLQNPSKTPSSLTQLHVFLSRSSPSALQPFFDYTLFPLLLLLDAAVHSRSPLRAEKSLIDDTPKAPVKVSDIAAEGVLQCLEELMNKCHLGSVEQVSKLKEYLGSKVRFHKLCNSMISIPPMAALFLMCIK